MCELFAMSSQFQTKVSFSLERFTLHSGLEGELHDGWGVAFYEGRDALLLREPNAAVKSLLVRHIEQHTPPSNLVISHIRRATHGEIALRNTQPFSRELGGRLHVFAHNGELGAIEPRFDFASAHYQPIGETDSEIAFCNLLERLRILWEPHGRTLPTLASRMELVAAFALQLRKSGPANFLYSDSDTLFAHSDRRCKKTNNESSQGLHILECKKGSISPSTRAAGVEIASNFQKLVMVATVPLTEKSWRPFDKGEIVAIRKGEIVDALTL